MSFGPDPARAPCGAERAAAAEPSCGHGGCLHNSLWQKGGGNHVQRLVWSWSGARKSMVPSQATSSADALGERPHEPELTYGGCPPAFFFRQERCDELTGSAWPSGSGAERTSVWSKSSRSVGRPCRAGGSSGACWPRGSTLSRSGRPARIFKKSATCSACKAREIRRALALHGEEKRRADRQLKVRKYKLKRSYAYTSDGPISISHTSS